MTQSVSFKYRADDFKKGSDNQACYRQYQDTEVRFIWQSLKCLAPRTRTVCVHRVEGKH